MRCPYPDCKEPEQGVSQLAGDVYRCEACLRVALRCGKCPKEMKSTLNRPFSQYCRRCGTEFTNRYDLKWQLAGQFDRCYEFSSEVPSDPISIACLSDLSTFHFDASANEPELLVWAFVDGLLAIHQPGGGIAVLDAFPPLVSYTATEPLFQEVEFDHVFDPDAANSLARYAYPIARTRDGRQLLFSNPYAVFSLDLRSLPNVTVPQEDARFRVLVDLTQCTEWELAVAPVTLKQPASAVGLLFRNRLTGKYHWDVINANQKELPNFDDEYLSQVKSLPLVGEPCQFQLVADRVIALSTPQEHWIWNCDAAATTDVQQLRRTRVSKGTEHFVLDQQVAIPNAFRWAKQFAFYSGENGFHWCYQHAEGSAQETNSYFVPLDGREERLPQSLLPNRTVFPLGPWRSPEAGGLEEMLFLARGTGADGEIYRRMPGRDSLTRTNQLTTDPYKFNGLYFRDPLLVILSVDDEGKQKTLGMVSLSRPAIRQRVHGLKLRADPLVWARWLYTCEAQGDELRIFQRELKVQLEDGSMPSEKDSSTSPSSSATS